MAFRQLSRRKFLKTGALGAAALSIGTIVPPRLFASAVATELVFRPYPSPQAPKLDFVYAADAMVDPFKSSIHATADGIVVPADIGKRFSVNTRWYVEGFGYLWLAADNGGELYSIDEAPKGTLNLKVVKILNNCCPWAEYISRGRMARMDATRPLRSPRQFMKDTIDAGIDFDILGIQIYFPQRDFSDIVRLLERLAALGKPMYITEFGASSDLRPLSLQGNTVTRKPPIRTDGTGIGTKSCRPIGWRMPIRYSTASPTSKQSTGTIAPISVRLFRTEG